MITPSWNPLTCPPIEGDFGGPHGPLPGELEGICPHGVPNLFLGDCEPCSMTEREALLRAEGWCPVRERDEAREALARVRNVFWNLGGPANRDAQGNWVVWPEWEQQMLAIIAAVIDPPSS